jgi:hypothetical protein
MSQGLTQKRPERLASYARHADDDSVRKMVNRIQARAVCRCGELLKQFDGRGRPAKNVVPEDNVFA